MTTTFWFVAGITFILAELVVIPGIGFLFLGFGAILLGGLITFNVLVGIELQTQIMYFLLFTALWWIALWKPLKRAIKKTSGEEYKNLADASGVVDDERDLTAGKIGHVKWSGTRMRAKIVPGSTTERIVNGETVWVHEQKDGVLLVDITKK